MSERLEIKASEVKVEHSRHALELTIEVDRISDVLEAIDIKDIDMGDMLKRLINEHGADKVLDEIKGLLPTQTNAWVDDNYEFEEKDNG